MNTNTKRMMEASEVRKAMGLPELSGGECNSTPESDLLVQMLWNLDPAYAYALKKLKFSPRSVFYLFDVLFPIPKKTLQNLSSITYPAKIPDRKATVATVVNTWSSRTPS